MDNQSEVARLREQIDREVEALQLLKNGFAVVTSRKIINHHYDALGVCYEELAQQIGSEAAIDVICERVNKLQ